ncbi:hypothetical protein [Rhizorhabdus histidinilytica]|uniref:hypothetical protein n=1 Tax=Rhizorhabdus histidinilytica TaxID=439228 RepID=UPI003220639F
MKKRIAGAALLGAVLFGIAAKGAIRETSTRVRASIEWARGGRQTAHFTPNEKVLTPADWRGARIYLFSGLHNGPGMWDQPMFRPLVKHLLANGWQIVIMDSHVTVARHFDDGGISYCRALREWIDDTDHRLDRATPARHRVLFGISFGGYQAMMATAQLPWVDGYVAISPVTRIQALSEFWFQNNDRCNPFGVSKELSTRPGFVSYGDSDNRVNSVLIKDLVEQVRPTTIVHPGKGHEAIEEYRPSLRWLADLDLAV